MDSKNKFDLFQEVINDINEIRDSLDMEELNETCFNIEQKWTQLQEKYSKLACIFLYLGCPYKKKESRSSNLNKKMKKIKRKSRNEKNEMSYL